jgi:hypothetical protein
MSWSSSPGTTARAEEFSGIAMAAWVESRVRSKQIAAAWIIFITTSVLRNE